MLLISNFVLDIYNINFCVMKRAILIFILSALVIITSVFWFANAKINLNLGLIMQFAVLVMVVGLAVFIGVKRLRSVRRGEPAEDELSRRIMVKASSVSFYISIYLWLFIMFFSERIDLPNHTLIGIGILGMAVVFVLSWVILTFRGVKDE